MPLNTTRARQLLSKGDLRALFIEELGWDRHNARLDVIVGGSSVALQALAQKRGMVAYQCATPAGEPLPDYTRRRKIEQQVAKSAHEHLIVFTDAGNETQIWQWVKREPGKPAACREHTFHRSQPGDALLQKLEAIVFTLAEEELVALPEVTRRARAGFDVERITKQFYDRFQKEHAAFLKFITGITESANREWYASVMLNRLMFVYFVQRKGFLDGDRDYLRNRLGRLRSEQGKNKFYSFYRYFLLRLFHEGLGGKKRTQELEKLIGRIPYLNGGLFDMHELEMADSYGKNIQIPDQAFERIFDYFDQYQWHLDERPLRADNEINPDVLGYIFEKYINQKQMGAYYTKEDITEYISQNTVLPFVVDAARKKCKVAFENPGGPTVWNLLKTDPDRYIYEAVRHGVGEPLPVDIAAGLKPKDLLQSVSKGLAGTVGTRKGWNKPAPATHALPTETWREVVERRQSRGEVVAKLAAGEVRDINDLITLNLDIRQFVQDAIENSEGPDLLRAFWHGIEKVTILDPTCGSGAFLFAALNILEPLYEACLDRMGAFVEDLSRAGVKAEKFSDFSDILARVEAHPNRRYFIFKSIILNNLFGVDIMEEAVEICKLRLFLKLAAQVEPDTAVANLGIEPLPDIDFNIRAGNTLVGYATYGEVKHALASKLDFDNAAERIEQKASELQQVLDAFRAHQTEGDGTVPAETKEELRKLLKALDGELNRYLASDYEVEPAKKDAYNKWLKSHQPFHWFVEFHGIMARGGFDVVIGNPPYVEYQEVKATYSLPKGRYVTESCGNLYAFTYERCLGLVAEGARIGLIIPVSSMCTDGYAPLQTLLLRSGSCFLSHFNDRPGKLFDGLEHIRLSIVLHCVDGRANNVFSTTYSKWATEERPYLFDKLRFERCSEYVLAGSVPKVGGRLQAAALHRLRAQKKNLGSFIAPRGGTCIYYTRKLSHFVQILNFVPRITDGKGALRHPSELKDLCLQNKTVAGAALAFLNSSLFYWTLSVYSDCRNLNKREILNAQLDLASVPPDMLGRLAALGQKLMQDLDRQSRVVEMNYKKFGVLRIQCTYPKLSKAIIDEIDGVLAGHYGFTNEELDFVINYDIKYRMGADTEGDEE